MDSWRDWLVNRVTITFGLIAIVVAVWNLYVATHADGILTGRVVGPGGEPVAGATVVLHERSLVSISPIAETRTDDAGRFRFEKHDQHALVLTAAKEEVGASGRRSVRLYFRNQNRRLDAPLRLRPDA